MSEHPLIVNDEIASKPVFVKHVTGNPEVLRICLKG
jgi:hypothetical protein